MRWDDWRFVDLELVDELEAPLKRIPSMPGLWPTFPSLCLVSPEEEAESSYPLIAVGNKVTRGPVWSRAEEGESAQSHFSGRVDDSVKAFLAQMVSPVILV